MTTIAKPMRNIMLKCLAVQVLALVACTGSNTTPGDDSVNNDSTLVATDGEGQDMEAEEQDKETLKIAVTPTLDCLPLFVASERGMFKAENTDVRLCLYQAQMDCDTAFLNGWVDGMVSDVVRTERLKQQGTALRYAGSTDLHWQLVTMRKARIKKLSQLDDHMIAMTRYSATAMLTDMMIDSAQLTAEQVFRIQVNDVGVRLSMLENNIMDAMWLPEPQATVARLLESPVLYDTRKDSLCLGVLAFGEKLFADTLRQRQVEALQKTYVAACDSINERGVVAYKDLLVKYCKVKPAVIDSMGDSIRFTHPVMPPEATIQKAKAWLKKN